MPLAAPFHAVGHEPIVNGGGIVVAAGLAKGMHSSLARIERAPRCGARREDGVSRPGKLDDTRSADSRRPRPCTEGKFEDGFGSNHTGLTLSAPHRGDTELDGPFEREVVALFESPAGLRERRHAHPRRLRDRRWGVVPVSTRKLELLGWAWRLLCGPPLRRSCTRGPHRPSLGWPFHGVMPSPTDATLRDSSSRPGRFHGTSRGS
jgi:hypothetical protein